jgi:hypothetical protein
MELLNFALNIFTGLGAGNFALFSIIVCFVAWVYMKIRQEKKSKEVEQEHGILIANNTKAVESLGETLRMQCATFEKVSDKLSSHDQRSIEILNTLVTIQNSLITVTQRQATIADINRLHERIDNLIQSVVSKNDFESCLKQLDEIQKDISRLCGKVGC